MSVVSKWIVRSGAQRAINRFGGEWQFGEPDADGVSYGVRDGGGGPERAGFTDTLGAVWAIVLRRIDRFIDHDGRQIEDARDLVVGERCIGHLPGLELHFFLHGEPKLHDGGAGNLITHDL